MAIVELKMLRRQSHQTSLVVCIFVGLFCCFNINNFIIGLATAFIIVYYYEVVLLF